jgi:preprotein translocase subunit SecE
MPVVEEKKPMAKAVALPSDNSQPNGVSGFITRARSFFGDVRGEMRKVVTPTREEVQSTTTVVIVAVFVFAAFFYVVDSVLDQALRVVLHWLGGAQ